MRKIVLDIEHPADLKWYEKRFKLSWVGILEDKPLILRPEKSVTLLKELKDSLFIGHNIKYDICCLWRAGIIDYIPENIFDTMLVALILNEDLNLSDIGLKTLMKRLFKEERDGFNKDLDQNTDEFKNYLKQDLYDTKRLFEYEVKRLEKRGLKKYAYLVMRAYPSVISAEINGFKWNLKQVEKYLLHYVEQRSKAETELKKELGDIDFNSSQQLSEKLVRLFDCKELKTTPKSDKISVDEENLNLLKKKYPESNLIDNILQYKKSDKIINTFIIPYSERAMESFDERLHPDFLIGTKGGRIRCSNPNLQQVINTKEWKIRDLLVAEKGHKLCILDYSQQELRIMAHISGEPAFVDAFCQWQCSKCRNKGKSDEILHKCPICGCEENEEVLKGGEGFWHGKDLHSETLRRIPVFKERVFAKQGNFSLIYGGTAKGMHKRYPDLSIEEWQEAINDFFKAYPYIKRYHTIQEEALKYKRETKDLFGRIRKCREKNYNEFHWKNIFYNFPIQSSGAGMLYMSLFKIRKRLKDLWIKEVKLVNLVHDELVFEIKEELIDTIVPIIVYEMEHCVKLKVPIRVDYKIVDKWGEAK